jgi:DNA-binding NtrC family response regulator
MSNPYQILIVEDEAQWRQEILCEALEDQGYQVQTSDSYEQAVAALDRHTFDLIVIDINLTGVSGNQDGIRVLERLDAMRTEIQTIVISGSRTRAMAAESVKKFHPLAFIDKTTFDVVAFINLVAGALQGSAPGTSRTR